MCLPIRPMIASSLCTCVCDVSRIIKRAAAIRINTPIKNACRRIRDWLSLHRRDHGTGLEDRQSTRSPFYLLKPRGLSVRFDPEIDFSRAVTRFANDGLHKRSRRNQERAELLLHVVNDVDLISAVEISSALRVHRRVFTFPELGELNAVADCHKRQWHNVTAHRLMSACSLPNESP